MNTLLRTLGRRIRPVGMVALLVVMVGVVSGCTTMGNRDAVERRWDPAEAPYDEVGFHEKIGRNVRDGIVGMFDAPVQGFYSTALIASPYGGFLASKIATIMGDVVGLVDDNCVTRHVFNGVLSRHLLRFGGGAARMPRGMGGIHDTKFEAPEMTLDDYVGDRYFHVKAYIEPSGLVTLGAAVISDGLIRPAGSFITIFGFRGTGESMDKFGKDLIEKSLKVKFL